MSSIVDGCTVLWIATTVLAAAFAKTPSAPQRTALDGIEGVLDVLQRPIPKSRNQGFGIGAGRLFVREIIDRHNGNHDRHGQDRKQDQDNRP